MRILTLTFIFCLVSSIAQSGTFTWNSEEHRNERWNEVKAQCLNLWTPNINEVVICRIEQHVASKKIVLLTKTLRPDSPEASILVKCADTFWMEKPDAVRMLGCYNQRKQALNLLLSRR